MQCRAKKLQTERASVPAMTRYSKPENAGSPILIVPYMWIGDFVRCHSVVKLLNAQFPDRPVDILSTHYAPR